MDSLINFETVKYYGAEKYEVERYERSLLSYQEMQWNNLASLQLLNLVQIVIVNMGLFAGCLLCAYYIIDHHRLSTLLLPLPFFKLRQHALILPCTFFKHKSQIKVFIKWLYGICIYALKSFYFFLENYFTDLRKHCSNGMMGYTNICLVYHASLFNSSIQRTSGRKSPGINGYA